MVWEIPAAEHEIIRQRATNIPIVLAARAVGGQTGDIEIVRDELGDRLRRNLAIDAGPRVWDVAMEGEAKQYILAKKFHRLQVAHHERDHYDILWAAYNDRDTLVEAAKHFTTPDMCAVDRNGSTARRRGAIQRAGEGRAGPEGSAGPQGTELEESAGRGMASDRQVHGRPGRAQNAAPRAEGGQGPERSRGETGEWREGDTRCSGGHTRPTSSTAPSAGLRAPVMVVFRGAGASSEDTVSPAASSARTSSKVCRLASRMYLFEAPGARRPAVRRRAAGARAGAALPPSSAREPSPSPSSPWSPRCRCVRRVGSSRVSRRCVVSVPVSCTLPRRCVVAAHCLYRRQGGARASTPPLPLSLSGGGREGARKCMIPMESHLPQVGEIFPLGVGVSPTWGRCVSTFMRFCLHGRAARNPPRRRVQRLCRAPFMICAAGSGSTSHPRSPVTASFASVLTTRMPGSFSNTASIRALV